MSDILLWLAAVGAVGAFLYPVTVAIYNRVVYRRYWTVEVVILVDTTQEICFLEIRNNCPIPIQVRFIGLPDPDNASNPNLPGYKFLWSAGDVLDLNSLGTKLLRFDVDRALTVNVKRVFYAMLDSTFGRQSVRFGKFKEATDCAYAVGSVRVPRVGTVQSSGRIRRFSILDSYDRRKA